MENPPFKAGDATRTWTAPLQVSVTLGTPTLNFSATPEYAAANLTETFAGGFALGDEAFSTVKFPADSLSATSFKWKAALATALASKLAYENEATVESTARNVWGLQTCDFVQTANTQCFVASSDAAVLVAFRGTENLADWLSNINILASDRHYGTVHRGFLNAFLIVKVQLRSLISRFPGRPVVITGHSLGGALATIAAAEWQADFVINGVYTYGQPCVGKGSFPDFMANRFGSKFSRFVNDDDIVPRVPPTYRHVGRLFHLDSDGNLPGGPTELFGLGGEAAGPPVMSEPEFRALQEQLRTANAAGAGAVTSERGAFGLEGLIPSFKDHAIDRYIEKIAAKAV